MIYKTANRWRGIAMAIKISASSRMEKVDFRDFFLTFCLA